jgi:uncharacterized FAD-dependent dehydrogenase
MPQDTYDVIIVGAGPAGIFAALELASESGLSVLIIDKGQGIDARIRTIGDRSREDAGSRALVCGWGGAGAFSDGKLTLSAEVGGQLASYVAEDRLRTLMERVDATYVRFGAPEKVYGAAREVVDDLARRAAKADLRYVPSVVRHLGTDVCRDIVRRMHEELAGRVDVLTETKVAHVRVADGRVVGVETEEGRAIGSQFVIAAPGRSGADWLKGEAERLGLALTNNPVDVGLRVEVPAPVFEPLTEHTYEPKLIYYSRLFDDRVRTFCVCPRGEVVTENVDGVTTVNGHSYAHKKTANTNFALLVSTQFTEPFHEPIAYGRYLATLANIVSGGVLVQRFGDLESGRRSTTERIARGLVDPTLTSATPGDLSYVLPYRYLTGIIDMLHAIDVLAPGTASRHTLLYGVEVKFYTSRLALSPGLETQIENLYAVGDGAGITRGLVQASTSGLIAAQAILARKSGPV